MQKDLYIKIRLAGKTPSSHRASASLTLGKDAANDITVESSALPASYKPLRPCSKGSYEFLMAPGMDGTLRKNGHEAELSTLVAMGFVAKKGAYHVIELDASVTLELRFKDSGAILTLAFDDVPAEEIPRVAAPVKGSLAGTLSLHSIPKGEHMFLFILAASLTVNIVFALYINSVEVIRRSAMDELATLPPRFAKLILAPKAAPKPAEAPKPAPEEAKPEEETKKPEEKAKRTKDDRPMTAERKKVIDRVKTKGALGVIGSMEGGVFSNTSTAETYKNLDSILASARPMDSSGNPASDFNTATTRETEEVAGSLRQKGKSSEDLIEEKKKSSKAVSASSPGPGQKTSAQPRSKDEVYAAIRSYTGGLKYLYNNELKKTPSLRGLVTVRFTISADGKVTSAKIVKSTINHTGLETSIVERIKLWRFRNISPAQDYTDEYTFDFSPIG
ncbi:MAG: TonB family protein [Deltaproteobacteria bacterium]|nr:TonB family protein [Deltaproteobacteria bacterium]